IIRECLFEAARGRSYLRYNKSNQDGPAVKRLLVVKLAAPILELADGRLAQRARTAVGKIEAPLVGLGIIETQIQSLEVAGRAIGLEFKQIGAAIPNFADNAGSLALDPLRGAG